MDGYITICFDGRTARAPSGGVNAAVKGDAGTSRVRFVLQRYAGGTDLAQLTATVSFINAEGQGDIDLPEAVASGDRIELRWTIGKSAAAAAGNLQYELLFSDESGSTVWQTAPARLNIIDSLGAGEPIESREPDIVAALTAIAAGTERAAQSARTGASEAAFSSLSAEGSADSARRSERAAGASAASAAQDASAAAEARAQAVQSAANARDDASAARTDASRAETAAGAAASSAQSASTYAGAASQSAGAAAVSAGEAQAAAAAAEGLLSSLRSRMDAAEGGIEELRARKAGALIRTAGGGGTEFTVDGTVDSPVRGLYIEGQTVQQAAPSPDAPSPVLPLEGYDRLTVFDGSADENWRTGTGGAYFYIEMNAMSVDFGGVVAVSRRNVGEDKAPDSLTAHELRKDDDFAALCFGNPDGLDETGWRAALAAAPETVFWRSSSFDPTAPQYYAAGIEGEDGGFGAVGTAEAIAPLFGGDSLDLTNGRVRRVMRQRLFTGAANEAWGTYGLAVYTAFSISVADMRRNGRTSGYSNLFPARFSPSGSDSYGITYGADSRMVCITQSYERWADVSAFKAWLNENRLQIVYYLDTPSTAAVAVTGSLDGAAAGVCTLRGPQTARVVYAGDLGAAFDELASALAAAEGGI